MANKRIRDLDDGSALVAATDSIPVDRAGLDEAERVTLEEAVTSTAAVAANTAKVTYPSADSTKLAGIETAATADQSDAEIETAYNAQVAAASQVEAEAGSETAIRRFSPLRVKQAIDALGGGGSGSGGEVIQTQGQAETTRVTTAGEVEPLLFHDFYRGSSFTELATSPGTVRTVSNRIGNFPNGIDSLTVHIPTGSGTAGDLGHFYVHKCAADGGPGELLFAVENIDIEVVGDKTISGLAIPALSAQPIWVSLHGDNANTGNFIVETAKSTYFLWSDPGLERSALSVGSPSSVSLNGDLTSVRIDASSSTSYFGTSSVADCPMITVRSI